MNRALIHKNLLTTNLIGWFAIAFSKDIKAGQSIKKQLLNKHITLIRNLQGELFCHGHDHHIAEKNNIIYIWQHPNGILPLWHIPILNQEGWSPFLYRELIIHSHPQEIYENSLDIAHFSKVHDFSQVHLLAGPCFDTHTMSLSYSLKRKRKKILDRQGIKAEFEMRLYGLSCAHTHIFIPSSSMRVRMFTLATPIQSGQVTIRLAIAIAFSKANFMNKFTRPLIHRLIQKNIIEDFCEDVPIWEHKQYFLRPLLVKGDGQIIKFRRWSNQFYA